jgi:hypothetical protein
MPNVKAVYAPCPDGRAWRGFVKGRGEWRIHCGWTEPLSPARAAYSVKYPSACGSIGYNCSQVPWPALHAAQTHRYPATRTGPCPYQAPTHPTAQRFSSTVLLAVSPCTGSCTVDFWKGGYFHWVTKADLRISIKDYHRNKSLRILLCGPRFPCW